MSERDRRTVSLIIPAFNEGKSISGVIKEVKSFFPDWSIVVINDGSTDDTAEQAASAGAVVIDLPFNLGVGGAVQTGLKYAVGKKFDYILRCDGDGQHSAEALKKIFIRLAGGDCDFVIGSRFLNKKGYQSSFSRRLGIAFLNRILSFLCRQRISDSTSGLNGFSRRAAVFLSRYYPAEFPEPETIFLLKKNNYKIVEVEVEMRERTEGKSFLSGWIPFVYIFKVLLAILIEKLRKGRL